MITVVFLQKTWTDLLIVFARLLLHSVKVYKKSKMEYLKKENKVLKGALRKTEYSYVDDK